MDPITASDVQPSVDSVPILLQPGERSPFDTSVAAGFVGLVYLAKQAFEEKRRKQCLEVVTAILRIQPDHAEALSIQAAVRSDLEREFESARDLAREGQSRRDRLLCSQAAAVLRRIVDADAENVEARALLYEMVAASAPPASGEGASATGRGNRRSILVGSVALVVLAAVLALPKGTDLPIASPSQTRAPAAATETQSIRLNAAPVAVENTPGYVPLLPGSPSAQTPDALSAHLLAIQPPRPVAPLPPRNAAASPAPALTGNLAISSAVPVEIYRGEEHLGSTPATLQLPSGLQTLEYRYQGLRQTVTHNVAPQQTTTATIQFLTKVQINAKPWAQVFVDGTRMTPIGQTPLGDISVPIGSVLVFQNPGFPDKRYRVTAKDAAIQITFP